MQEFNIEFMYEDEHFTGSVKSSKLIITDTQSGQWDVDLNGIFLGTLFFEAEVWQIVPHCSNDFAQVIGECVENYNQHLLESISL